MTNNGSVAGTAVPQVYLGAPATVPSGVQFAKKALAAYGRVALAAGQTKTVTLHVRVRQLQYWTDVSRLDARHRSTDGVRLFGRAHGCRVDRGDDRLVLKSKATGGAAVRSSSLVAFGLSFGLG